ncbi:MAG: hypothetical protein N2Z65_07300, partial [Clostridiales bacterium]|nr:hypothetical protein [Clostridiales bacterium]
MLKYCRKRLFAVFLSLCIVLEISPAAFAVSAGKLTIEGKEVKLPLSGGVIYEETNTENSKWWLSCTDGAYTLTLNNAKFEKGITSTLDNLIISVPEGTKSSILSSGNCINSNGNLFITGGGTLSVSNNTTENYATVYAADHLMIRDGAKVDVTGRSDSGIWSNVVTIEDGSVSVRVSYSGNAACAGIYGGSLSIVSSNVTVNSSGGGVARAIYSGSG